jgi:hypothetical protein
VGEGGKGTACVHSISIEACSMTSLSSFPFFLSRSRVAELTTQLAQAEAEVVTVRAQGQQVLESLGPQGAGAGRLLSEVEALQVRERECVCEREKAKEVDLMGGVMGRWRSCRRA